MLPKEPSRTARGAAGHRAAHQIVEQGAIFRDPFARRILREEDLAEADARAADPATKAMRFFIAARSRFAEDALAKAVASGMRQAVVLGAGFDTFALRNSCPDLTVFEVDHPATQAWKRERLAAEAITLPDTLRFAAVDFEREDLAERLVAGGFACNERAFFLWLGVVPYLSREAIFAVLRLVARCAGNEIAFDYGLPPESYSAQAREHARAFAARVAELGEPFLTYFTPDTLHPELHVLGFREIEDLDFAAVAARYFPQVPIKPDSRGGHLIRARAG
jgi:methyltransferase (TIGR00027 family)